MCRTLLSVSLATLLSAGVASASPFQTEEMREKTRSLGFTVGNQFACAEAAARETIEEEAHIIFDFMLKDVGSNIAWVFATAAGYGASVQKTEIDCAETAKNWAEIRADFGIEDGE
ncbi:MAG: hypothetical protein AAF074_14575 [Pseudomonadota bacterium]